MNKTVSCLTPLVGLLLLGGEVSAAQWTQQRIIDDLAQFPLRSARVVGDGEGGFWYSSFATENPGVRFINEVGRLRQDIAGNPGQRPLPTANNGLLPLDEDHVLLVDYFRAELRANAAVVDSSGLPIAHAYLRDCGSSPVRDGIGGFWLNCGQQLRHYDQQLNEISRLTFDPRQPHRAVDLQLDRNGQWLLLTHDQETVQSCVIAMNAGGGQLWRTCLPNHTTPRMAVADDRIFLELGVSSAALPITLSTLALNSGAVERTENHLAVEAPPTPPINRLSFRAQTLGNELIGTRVNPESGEIELARYAPDSGWQALYSFATPVDFQVLEHSIVLIDQSEAGSTLLAVDIDGEILWQQDLQTETPTGLEALGTDSFALLSGRPLINVRAFDSSGDPSGLNLASLSGNRFGSFGAIDPVHGRFWTYEYDYIQQQLTLRGLGITPADDISASFALAPERYEGRIDLRTTDSWVCLTSMDLQCTRVDASESFSADLAALDIEPPRQVRLADTDENRLRFLAIGTNSATTVEFDSAGVATVLAREQFPGQINVQGFSADSGALLSEHRGLVTGPVTALHRLATDGRLSLSTPISSESGLRYFADANGSTVIFSQPVDDDRNSQIQMLDEQGNQRWLRQARESIFPSQFGESEDSGALLVTGSDSLRQFALEWESGEVRWSRAYGPDLYTNNNHSFYLEDPAAGRVQWLLQSIDGALYARRTRLQDGKIDIRLTLPCPFGRCEIHAAALSANGQLWLTTAGGWTSSTAPILSTYNLQTAAIESIPALAAPSGLVRMLDDANSDQGLLTTSPSNVLASDAFWYGFVRDKDGHSFPRWWRVRGTNADRGPGEHNLLLSHPGLTTVSATSESIIGTASLQPMNDGQWLLNDEVSAQIADAEYPQLFRSKSLTPLSAGPGARLWLPADRQSGFFYEAAGTDGRWGLPSGRWLTLKQTSPGSWLMMLDQDSADEIDRLPGHDSGKTSTPVGSVRLVTTACHSSRLLFSIANTSAVPELTALRGEQLLRREGSCN